MCSFQRPKKSGPTCSHGTCALVGFCIKERQHAQQAASIGHTSLSGEHAQDSSFAVRVPLATSHIDASFRTSAAVMISAPSVVLEREMKKMELHSVSEEHLICDDLQPPSHLLDACGPAGAKVMFPINNKAVEEMEKEERPEEVNC